MDKKINIIHVIIDIADVFNMDCNELFDILFDYGIVDASGNLTQEYLSVR